MLGDLEFDYDADHYIVKITSDKVPDLTQFLYNNKDMIKDYEVIKGTMDDVFLTLTGRKMGDNE